MEGATADNVERAFLIPVATLRLAIEELGARDTALRGFQSSNAEVSTRPPLCKKDKAFFGYAGCAVQHYCKPGGGGAVSVLER